MQFFSAILRTRSFSSLKKTAFALTFSLLALASVNVFAQLSTKYTYSQPTGSAYTVVTGTTICSGNGANTSSAWYQGGAANTASTGIPLGFSFVYNCATYTTIGVHTNGFIWFGNGTPGSGDQLTPAANASTNLGGSGAINGLICAFAGTDQGTSPITLRPIGASSYIKYSSSGGVFTIEWGGYKINLAGATNNLVPSFEIKLYQTTNVIEVLARGHSNIGIGSSNDRGQIGLRAGNNTDFSLIAASGTGASGWAAASANTTTNTTNTPLGGSGYWGANSASGNARVFRWTPAGVCCTAPGTNASGLGYSALNPGAGTATITFTRGATGAGGTSAGVVVIGNEGAIPGTPPVTGTVYSCSGCNAFGTGTAIGTGKVVYASTTAGDGTSTVTINLTGLTTGKSYFFSVYEYSTTGSAACYVVSPASVGFCFGAPSVATVAAASTSICGATSSNPAGTSLSLTGLNAGGFYTYKWQSSGTSGTGFADASGTNTSTTYAVGTTLPFSPTYYICNVTCPHTSNTTASSERIISYKEFYDCYQPATSSTSPATGNTQLNRVQLNGNSVNLDNTSGQPGAPYWNDYPTPIVDLSTGNTYTVTVTYGTTTSANSNTAIWIDYNHNGVFEHPAERVATHGGGGGTGNPVVFTIPFTVSGSATAGITGMRIRYRYYPGGTTGGESYDPYLQTGGSSNTTGQYSETEDYRVTIAASSCSPSIPASGNSETNITTSGARIQWTANGNGDGGVVVVVKQGAAPTPPTSLTPYNSPNADITGGGSTTAAGSYVVYKGTGSQVDVSGLLPNLPYYYAIYSFNSSTDCYNTTSPAASSFSTANTAMTYTTTIITQASTASVTPNSTNNAILGIRVDVSTGTSPPLTLSSLTFNTNGSTQSSGITDISAAKIWYTGSTSTYTSGSGVQFGANVTSFPGGSSDIVVTPGSGLTLSPGSNYFWITYNVPATPTVTVGHVLDAECTSVTVGTPRTIGSPAPSGTRTVLLTYCVPDPGFSQQSRHTIAGVAFTGTGSTFNYSITPSTSPEYEITSYTGNISAGATYTFSITRNSGGLPEGSRLAAWIDYNTDGDFTDAGEMIADGTGAFQLGGAGGSTGSGTVTIPSNASAGTLRMRVWVWYDCSVGCSDPTLNPCLVVDFSNVGQVKDFNLNVAASGPTAYSVTGGTTNCGSATIGVANSQTGVNYQLKRTISAVTTNVGSPAAGSNGNAVNFGAQTTAGAYTVLATDGTGNTTLMTGTVNVYDIPVTTADNGGPYCSYGTIALTSSLTATTYLWSNGATTKNTNLAALNNGGTYTVTVTESHGCTGSAGTSVIVNVAPTVIVNHPTNNICLHDVVSLSASGADTYSWSPVTRLELTSVNGSTADVDPQVPTVYTVTGTDGNNCSASATAAFTIKPVPVMTAVPVSAVCTGGTTANLSVVGDANTYAWLPNSFLNTYTGTNVTASIAQLTFYTVTGTGLNNCTTSLVIPVATVPVGGIITPVNTVICDGGAKTLTASGMAGNSYQWQISPDNVVWDDIIGATGTSYATIAANGHSKKYYRIKARSNACWDVASTTAIVDISVTPVVTVTGTGSDNVQVSWTPFGSQQYSISWSGLAGSGTIAANLVTSNNITVPGLLANKTVTVTVTPVTPVCGSNAGSVVTHTVCDRPTITNLTATASHGFQLNWSAVSGVTDYRIYYRNIGNSNAWSFTDVSGVTARTFTNMGGGTYVVYVAAKGCPLSTDIGTGSEQLYVTMNPQSSCTTPTVSAISNCPNQISVGLSGGSGSYVLSMRRISPTISSGASYTINGSGVNITVGTQYSGSTWEIFAKNICAGSTLSEISNIVIVTVKPGCSVINNVVLSNPNCHGFVASWNTDDCQGLGISGYQVLIKTSTATGYSGYPVGAVDHVNVSWLTQGRTYNVVVMSLACNGASSAYSVVQTVPVPFCNGREDEEPQALIENNEESVTVYPNPGNGTFMLNIGTMTMEEQDVKTELVNQLGQVLMTDISAMSGGSLNRQLTAPQQTATGVYYLRTTIGDNVYINRLMINKE